MIYHTPQQLAQQYGEPISSYRDMHGRVGTFYRVQGYLIMVQLLDGVSQSEVYVKETDEPLLEPEIAAILKANAYGEEWESLSKVSPDLKGWFIRKTGAMSMVGPTFLNDRRYQNAISVGTYQYNQHTKALNNN